MATNYSNQKRNKISINKMLQDARKPAAFIGGIMLAKGTAKLIDKNEAVEGLFGSEGKALIKPLGITVIGLGANQMVRNHDLKNVSMGVATYGGILALEAATGKPVINGLQGVDNRHQQLPAYEDEYYDDYDDYDDDYDDEYYEDEYSYDDEIAAIPANPSINIQNEVEEAVMDGGDYDEGDDYDEGVEGFGDPIDDTDDMYEPIDPDPENAPIDIAL